MPKPITIIEPPCLFCGVHPSKKQFTGRARCHKCDAIYRQHEQEESLRRDSVEWIYEMAAAIRPADREPQGLPRIAADVTEVQLGARVGRVG